MLKKLCIILAILFVVNSGVAAKIINGLASEKDQLIEQVQKAEKMLEDVLEETEAEALIQAPVLRYSEIEITDADITYAALAAYHESRGESFEGIRGVIEVIFNRVLSEEWPNSVREVIFQEGQFDCAAYLTSADINEPERLTVCYDAVNYVLHNDDYVLDANYGYFKSTPYTSCSYIQIGNHYFARM